MAKKNINVEEKSTAKKNKNLKIGKRNIQYIDKIKTFYYNDVNI